MTGPRPGGDGPRVMFVGKGPVGITWYRVILPAAFMGADWSTPRGDDDDVMLAVGASARMVGVEALREYDVVVLQQMAGPRWLREIAALREAGVTVLFEIDDDLHAVAKMRTHDFAARFTRDLLADVDAAMEACDGLIVSTAALARRYERRNPRAWVCENGLDLRRYDYTRPERPHVTIGWSGATGHLEVLKPWLREVDRVMHADPGVRFVSVGLDVARLLEAEHGIERCTAIPFGNLETYPAAMTHFDVALAPADRTGFFRAKSDLRWMEASALGIAVIADPVVYPYVQPGVTGMHAATPAQAGAHLDAIVADPGLARRIGAQAREWVREHRDMRVAVGQWRRAIEEAARR